jgi:alpha-beta hydrolase superfamily lysophospholipase
MEHDDYWFHYVLNEDPIEIKKSIREEYISSKNLNIHLDIYENENTTNKIFVHGNSVYSRFYAEVCFKLFKKGFRIIAPDMVGHGLSEGKRGYFTIERWCETIYDVTTHVINTYGENIVYIGSSLGGITGLYYAAYDDNRFKGIVCHNAALLNEKPQKAVIKEKWKRMLVPLVPIISKIFPKLRISVWIYLDFRKYVRNEELVKNTLKDQLLVDKYTLSTLRDFISAPFKKPIEEIKTPILILSSDEDDLFPVNYETAIYNRLQCKNKRLEILEDTPHLIFHENIEGAINRIEPWIDSLLK